MAKVIKSVARTDRYEYGKRIDSDKNKNGFTIDKTQPRDENDRLFCKKGETYYYWAFAFSPKQYSLTMPKASQLTQSEFYGTFYAIQENLEDSVISNEDDFNMVLEEIKSQCEELRDAQEEKRENMISGNQNLENTPVAELLQERYDAMEDVCSELDNCDWEELEFDDDEFEGMDEEEIEAEKQLKLDEHLEEQKQKITDALDNMCA